MWRYPLARLVNGRQYQPMKSLDVMVSSSLTVMSNKSISGILTSIVAVSFQTGFNPVSQEHVLRSNFIHFERNQLPLFETLFVLYLK